MITNVIITLYKFNSKQKGNLYVLQIVLGAKNTLKGIKDSGKQKCVSERTLAWAAPAREMVEPVDTFKICRLNSILRCSELQIY